MYDKVPIPHRFIYLVMYSNLIPAVQENMVNVLMDIIII